MYPSNKPKTKPKSFDGNPKTIVNFKILSKSPVIETITLYTNPKIVIIKIKAIAWYMIIFMVEAPPNTFELIKGKFNTKKSPTIFFKTYETTITKIKPTKEIKDLKKPLLKPISANKIKKQIIIRSYNFIIILSF